MNNPAKLLLIIALLSIVSFAQKPKPKTPITKTTAKTTPQVALDEGKLIGKTYTNKGFGFEITFPDAWFIPDNDYFEAYLLKRGQDIRLKVPPTVKVLQTAYKFMPEMADNSIIRVIVEDLKSNPQIKDAVDYFDAMQKTFKTAKMPADFKYSEIRAEKLGTKQFAYFDSSSEEGGKKRIYATVKNGYAIMYVITYTDGEDIEILRAILSETKWIKKIN